LTLRALTVFLWGCLIAAAAVAGEQHESKIKIAVDGDGGEPKVFEWHSSDPESDLSNLDVGESKTLSGDDGQEVVVTRTEDGLTFDIDGEKLEMMNFSGDGEVFVDIDVEHDGMAKHKIHKIQSDDTVVINKSKNVKVIKSDHVDGVTIISSSEINDETRARIKQVLKDAGTDGEVMFVDGSELGDAHADGEHKVRVIKKKIETTD
jgi:hypothetical protein